MRKRLAFAGLRRLLAVTLLAVSCTEPAGPERRATARPKLATAAASVIALDQVNGTLNESGTLLAKGFNPTNPHNGDAIVATFFLSGSTTITRVSDHLSDVNKTPVGNTYNLVESVTSGGITMATYVATNVQNFPDASTNTGQILVVEADLSSPVTDGGLVITAWTGVGGVAAQHQSTSGSGSAPVTADPGAITLGAGALAYAVTMANQVVPLGQPAAPFTDIGVGSDAFLKNDAEYALSASGGSVDPQWTWFFNSQSTWLATVLALNPPMPHLVFTVQPSNTTAGSTISPPVQVAAQDDAGSTVPSFGGTVTIALGANPGGGTLSGTTSVTAVNGVATFSNLSIDQPGNGYTLLATATGLTSATSAAFNINAPPPPPPPSDFMTGGGKLGDGRDFATFGLNAGSAGGRVTWVQHCLRGARATSPTCQVGQFTFHGTVTPGTYAVVSGQTNCRTWSGSGDRKNKNNPSASGTFAFTVNLACDNGEPGRGVDFIDITIGGDYHASGFLTGGNIQLHGRS